MDELGGLTEAIAAAADQAELGDDWHVEEYPQPRQFEDALLDRIFGTSPHLTQGPSDAVTLALQHLKSELSNLQTLNDPRGVYTRLPFSTHID